MLAEGIKYKKKDIFMPPAKTDMNNIKSIIYRQLYFTLHNKWLEGLIFLKKVGITKVLKEP